MVWVKNEKAFLALTEVFLGRLILVKIFAKIYSHTGDQANKTNPNGSNDLPKAGAYTQNIESREGEGQLLSEPTL